MVCFFLKMVFCYLMKLENRNGKLCYFVYGVCIFGLVNMIIGKDIEKVEIVIDDNFGFFVILVEMMLLGVGKWKRMMCWNIGCVIVIVIDD